MKKSKCTVQQLTKNGIESVEQLDAYDTVDSTLITFKRELKYNPFFKKSHKSNPDELLKQKGFGPKMLDIVKNAWTRFDGVFVFPCKHLQIVE